MRGTTRRSGLVLKELRIVHETSDPEFVKPTRLRIEASSHCQLRCPSCPTTTGAINAAIGRGFLRFDRFQELIERNPQIRLIELSNYGEILLNPELLSILEFSQQRNVALTAGNGVNLNRLSEEVADGLVRCGLLSMTCSIDGASEASYRLYRVRGSFNEVIANVRRINRYKRQYESEHPHLIWQFVAFGHNEHEIPAARALAGKLNMEFRVKLNWDGEFSPIHDAESLREASGVGAASRDEFKRLNSGRDYQENICHQLWDQPQINWDGRVLGCCRNFWMNFGGNAFEDGLDEAVNHETMRYARRMLTGAAEPRADIPCTTCELYLNMRRTGLRIDRKSNGDPVQK